MSTKPGQLQYQATPACRQVELVAVFDVATALDDNIGVGFEQADQLLVGRHRLAGQHPSLALADDALDQRPIVAEPGLPQFDERIGRAANRAAASCR